MPRADRTLPCPLGDTSRVGIRLTRSSEPTKPQLDHQGSALTPCNVGLLVLILRLILTLLVGRFRSLVGSGARASPWNCTRNGPCPDLAQGTTSQRMIETNGGVVGQWICAVAHALTWDFTDCLEGIVVGVGMPTRLL